MKGKAVIGRFFGFIFKGGGGALNKILCQCDSWRALLWDSPEIFNQNLNIMQI